MIARIQHMITIQVGIQYLHSQELSLTRSHGWYRIYC